jgi:hypothetical protein
MAAADRIFEITTPPDNSALTPQYLVRCIGGVVPHWVERHARPFDGPLPPDRPIFDVNLGAEMAERAAAEAAFQQPDHVRFTNDELMRYMDWDVSDYIMARDIYGLPKADGIRQTGNDLLGGGGGEPVRLKSAVDAWVADWRAKLPVISRLVGDTEKPTARGFFRKR